MLRLLLPVFAICLAPLASAQTQSATVTGAVHDAAGAIMPNAHLTLINQGQNLPWKVVTNDKGEYAFLQIPPGTYSLRVEAAGFKRYQQDAFVLGVAQVMELDVRMEVGSVTETIEVTTQPDLIETANASLGEVINARTIESMPLNGRNAIQLVALTPGISMSSGTENNANASGSTSTNGFSANGGRDMSSSIMVDGSPQEVMGYNQPAHVPNPDALQEFKVQTNSLSAEYGRAGGAVINMITRSGSNKFRGVLYEFLRNDKFDANNFFNNLNGKPLAAFRYNQFGATLGGPLTRGRNRSFFFFAYEGLRQRNPGSSFFSVPTARMRTGDLAELSATIYDPLTVDASGNRQAFTGKQIPASRISPIAKAVIGYYPLPTTTGITNNFYTQAGSVVTDDSYTIRIDHRFSQNHNLFGRVSWNKHANPTDDPFDNIASPDHYMNGFVNRSATLDDTYLLGPWVLHANLGYAYSANPRHAPNGFALTSLGLPASLQAQTQADIFPRFDVGGFASLGNGLTNEIGNRFQNYVGSVDATRLFGRHTFKTGGTYRLNKVSNLRPNAPAGYFSFDAVWTRQNLTRAGGGEGLASMLLGLPQAGRIQNEPRLGMQVAYVAGFVQDDWRVTSRLTINLGLRWDSDRPVQEQHNRSSWFDTSVPLPLNVPTLGVPHGGLRFTNQPGAPNSSRDPDNNNFAPRLGVALKVTDRMVVRSGFAIFFAPSTGTGPNATNTGAVSFNSVTNIIASADGGRTAFATLANPYPNGFSAARNGADGLLSILGQSVGALIRDFPMPYSVQWNTGIQYQVRRNQLVDVTYAGNSGVKLQAQADLNQLPDNYLALGDQLNVVVPNPFAGIIPSTSSLGLATTTRGQLLRPFPQFLTITDQWAPEAHSSYHSLQAKYRQRFAGGLQFLAAYTFSKMLDNYSSVGSFNGNQSPGYMNANRKDWDKSVSSFHTPQRLVANFQYELPFGRGKSMLAHAGVLTHIVSGWSNSTVATMRSGFPISIGVNQNTSNSLGGGQRPISAGISSVTPGRPSERLARWINPAAFLVPASYTFGNVGRFLPDNLGPGLASWDTSIARTLRVTETTRIQIRGELFNMFNHPNFRNPGTLGFGLNANGSLANNAFGRITSAGPARVVQFGLKLYY